MTLPVSGGVPEQGLRDALEIIERHAALWAQSAEIYECSAPHDTLSKATCVGVRDTLRTIASEMRAALERPRPALPPDARITEPRGCPTPGACSCVGAETDALTVVLRDLANGIATALRDNRPVDNDLRYSLIWQSLERHGWNTLGVRPALPEAHGPECPQRPPRLVHELTDEPVLPCDCGAALPAEHAPPDLAPIVRDLISALWTQTRLVCTEQDHPRTMRCQSCASRESIDRAEAALRGSRPSLAGGPEALRTIAIQRDLLHEGAEITKMLRWWGALKWVNVVESAGRAALSENPQPGDDMGGQST